MLYRTFFCVVKGITELKAKCVHASDLIKKRHEWPKGVPGDLIDIHFEDKTFGGVGIIEVITDDNKLFKTFFMKYPGRVMKIMASWMTLDELDNPRIRRDFVESSGTKDTKQFTYLKPFGIHFRYIHQVDNHNNRRYAPIFLREAMGNQVLA